MPSTNQDPCRTLLTQNAENAERSFWASYGLFVEFIFPNSGSTTQIWCRAPFPQDEEPMPCKTVQNRGPYKAGWGLIDLQVPHFRWGGINMPPLTPSLPSLKDGWGNVNKNLPLFLYLLIKLPISGFLLQGQWGGSVHPGPASPVGSLKLLSCSTLNKNQK
jgi:hypothetical protein